jgi:CBS domain-containing protein
MKVRDAIKSYVATVQPGESLKDGARTLVARRISGLPVVDAAGRLEGMLSEGDILFRERGQVESIGGPLAWLISPGRLEEAQKVDARLVGEAMTSPAITIGPERPVTAAAALMIDRGVNRLPVVDAAGRLVGIITRADLVRVFARTDAEVAEEIRESVMRDAMWLEDQNVEVQVDNGEVTLRGHIDRQRDAELLPKLTTSVPGVVGVTSELTWSEND